MSIDGRINIDVLFHDTSGQRFKVVAFNEGDEYATGKVAIVTRTASGVTSYVPLTPTEYRDASGSLVSFQNVVRVVIKSNLGNIVYSDAYNSVEVPSGAVVVLPLNVNPPTDSLGVYSSGGTASYTMVLYGT